MSRTDESREWLALRRNKGFIEGYSFIAGQNGLTQPDQSIPVPNWRGNTADLVPSVFPLSSSAAQLPKCFKEERFDIVGLQTAGIRTLHFFSDSTNTAGVRGFRSKNSIFKQRPEFLVIKCP